MANKNKLSKNLSAKNDNFTSLYKFTSIATLLKILGENGGFRFSSLKCLNDAFESIGITNENLQTLSFTKAHSQTLMWAHYADKFQGAVIQIDKHQYNDLTVFQKVHYGPIKQRIDKKLDEEKVLFKGRAWAYENEYRVIINPEKNKTLPDNVFCDNVPSTKKHYFLKCFVKRIYFGPNVQDTYEYLDALKRIREINDEYKQQDKRRKNDLIKVEKYRIDDKKYALIIDKSFDYLTEIERLEKELTSQN